MIAELLLNTGAMINARGQSDFTTFQVASFAGNVGIVRMLLFRGAQVDAAGGRYGTALEAASGHGRFQVVELLLEFGASPAALGGPSQGLSTSVQAPKSHEKHDLAG